MTYSPIEPARFITTQAELQQLVKRLQNVKSLAIDTESNSLYAYQEQVCLIQLSTSTTDYIIDTLSVNARDLAPLMRDPKIEKIFHAAEYDVGCLKRDYGFEFENIFDTMWAARICGHAAFGLGSLLKHFFGVKLDKHHQRDNWGQRPLPAESLIYAQMDTHYLHKLRDLLYQELKENGHLEESFELFGDVCKIPALEVKEFDPEDFWSIGLPHSLTRKQMAILREVYILREELAEERDVPTFKVFTNKVLTAIALTEPHYEGELYNVPGLSHRQIQLDGSDLITAVERGRRNRLKKPPRHVPPPPDIAERFTALSTWRRERAEARGVGSDVIISRNTLWDIAYRIPETLDEMADIDGLGPWRLKTYGEEILEVLETFREHTME